MTPLTPIRKAALGVAAVGLTVLGGAVGAGIAEGSASAATAQADTSTTAPANAGAPRDPSQGGHTANGITEELLTGEDADQATAAAEAEVDGGTVLRVETDAEGAVYEAHVQKADGSEVTVKMDADFNVTSVEDGAA